MSTSITCPSCGKTANAPDGVLGKSVRCKACGTTFVAEPEGGFPDVEIAEVQTVLPADPDDEAPPRRGDDDVEFPRRGRRRYDEDDEEADRPRRRRAAVVDADEDEHDEDQPRKKTKRSTGAKIGMAFGLLVGLGAILAVAGVIVYLAWPTEELAPPGDWRAFHAPDRFATILMPGVPHQTRDFNVILTNLGTYSKFEMTHFQTKKTYTLEIVDVVQGAGNWTLDGLVAQQKNNFLAFPGAELHDEKTVRMDKYDGRELQFTESGPNGTEPLLVRYYVDPRKDNPRVYILTARGPRLAMGKGDAATFFNSFIIHQNPVNVP
jgi:ribosomal protein S27E